MSMNITEREALTEFAEWGQNMMGDYLRWANAALAALAEIERLEAEVRLERGLRAEARLESDATLRAMREQIDSLTDEMLRAGLRCAVGHGG